MIELLFLFLKSLEDRCFTVSKLDLCIGFDKGMNEEYKDEA